MVFHRDFLRNTLPKDHPLFSTPVFRSEVLALLVGKLRVGKFIDPVVGMTATGIPPTVKLITMMSEAMAKIEAFTPALEQSMAKIAQEMERILEERAIQSQQVTPEQLKTTMEAAMQKVLEHITSVSRPQAIAAPAAPVPVAAYP